MGYTQDSINFRNNIRNYNNAFASFGTNVDIPQGHGTYCFRIHGQTYHCTIVKSYSTDNNTLLRVVKQ